MVAVVGLLMGIVGVLRTEEEEVLSTVEAVLLTVVVAVLLIEVPGVMEVVSTTVINELTSIDNFII